MNLDGVVQIYEIIFTLVKCNNNSFELCVLLNEKEIIMSMKDARR